MLNYFKIGTFNRNAYLLFALCIFMMFSCKEEAETEIVLEKGQVTDVDGNIYSTVKIGNQWWMTENLRAKHFRNGNLINYSQSNESWSDTFPSCCLFDNNTTAPGLLYNWKAACNELAPTGWHIPTDDEWKQLEIFLGVSSIDANKNGWRGTNEGDKLKVEGTNGWTFYSGIWATNESGFTALAGGSRLYDGTWGDPALFACGFWWTASEASDTNLAYYRYLDYKKSNVFRSACDKGYGFSIRCVKD